MKTSFFFGLFVFAAMAWRPSWIPPLWDETCTFSREDLIRCAERKMDINHDERITRAEFKAMIDSFPFLIRKGLPMLFNIDKVFQGCDYDKDGAITPADFRASVETCLPEKHDLCTAEWICK